MVARVSRYSTVRPSGAEGRHAGYAVRAEQRRAALDLRRSETPLRDEPRKRDGSELSWTILCEILHMTELEKQLQSATDASWDYSKSWTMGETPSRNGGRCLVLYSRTQR